MVFLAIAIVQFIKFFHDNLLKILTQSHKNKHLFLNEGYLSTSGVWNVDIFIT